MKKLIFFLCVVFFAFSSTPFASGEEDPRSARQQASDECRSRTTDQYVYEALAKERKIPALDGKLADEKGVDGAIQDVKSQHLDLFEEKRRQLETEGKDLKSGDGMRCSVVSVFEAVGVYVNRKESEFWGDPVGKFTKAVMEGNGEALQVAMTFWMDIEVLSPTQMKDNARWVQNIVYFVTGFLMIASLIIGGIRMAMARQSGVMGGLEEIGEGVGKWLMFSIVVPAGTISALRGSDALAKAIMDEFGSKDTKAIIQIGTLQETKFGPVIMLALALVCLCGSVMQVVALVIRDLVLPIVLGLTPLFAAASFSETGRNGLRHLVGYIIAALAYKPACALIYVVVIWNTSAPIGDDGKKALFNAMMIAMVGFLAPSLVRMIVPAVAQAGGGSGGMALSAAVSATGAITGAAMGGVTGALSGARSGGSQGQQQAGGGGQSSGSPAGAGAPPGGVFGGHGGGSSSGAAPAGAAGGGHGAPPVAAGDGGSSSGAAPGGAAGGGHGAPPPVVINMPRQSRFGRAASFAARGASSGARMGGGAVRAYESMMENAMGGPGQIAR